MSLEKIIIAGFGGQGVLLLGDVIAKTAILEGKNATWLPSYGPESRSGTSNCHVIISDKQIGSPAINDPDVVIAFNLPSMDKFEPKLKENGLLLYNSSLIERKSKRTDIQAVAVPFTDIADKKGDTKVLNMVALGAYYQLRKTVDLEIALDKTLPSLLTGKKAAYIPLNKKAIGAGMAYIVKNVKA